MISIPFLVGEHTYGMENIELVHNGETRDGFQVNIGAYCSIAEKITFLGSCNHRTDWITTFPFGKRDQDIFPNFDGSGSLVSKGVIQIGNDVWIGRNATIQSGVHIGDGAIVAANAHVVKSVPPYSIVGGNPARVIKMRFTKEQREALLRIQWWSWSESKVNEELPLLCSGKVDEFCKKHDEQYRDQCEKDTPTEYNSWGC